MPYPCSRRCHHAIPRMDKGNNRARKHYIKKKKFKSRKSYRKRDPKTSDWWTDYIVDERGTFSDLSHREGKLFAYRFSFSLISVRELVSKIKEKEENFWKRNYDAAGREASPIDLLVLGSLRILTRNVTLDDLYEQTYISSEVHRLFFFKFIQIGRASCRERV